jgi:hypothetical protein
MHKALLALSFMILSGSVLAQESPITPRVERVQISDGPEVPLVGGYLTVIRWTVNNPGGLARALRDCALWYGSKKLEPNRQKSDQVKPLPFVDGVPGEPVRAPTEDDLLLQRGIDGFYRQERRSHQSNKIFHHTVTDDFVHVGGVYSGIQTLLKVCAYRRRQMPA